MEYYNYCTGCLEIGVKMYSLESTICTTNIDELFLQFLRIPLSSGKEAKTSFCFLCAALLRKFEKFRMKCLKAQEILASLRQDNFQVTKENLQNINREQHKLTSTMSINSTECVTINSIHEESYIISEKRLTACDVKQNDDSNRNGTVDINTIKTEEQDIDECSLHNYEDSMNQLDDCCLDKHIDYKESKNNDDVDIAKIGNHRIHKKHKRKIYNKEHKSKKRKKSDTCTKYLFESLSDDEPLANKASKPVIIESEINGIDKGNIRKNFNISYFEDYATVVFLTPEEAKKELLLRKETSNYINSPFKCEFCYRGYEAKAAFDNHMKKHSIDYGDYKCDICQLRFPEQRSLCKHRLASHKRKFCCKLCPYVCFCTHQAKTHVSLHKGKKYPCKECGEIFSMPNSLLMHKRLKHQTECVCDFCGNTFATPRGLYSHNMKVHRQDKNEKKGPKCEECCIHFATEEAWKRHLVLSSKHNVSNGCKNCGETFSNREELKSHMRVHARKHASRNDIIKLPATCNICNKYLIDRTEYKSHMTSAHPQSEIAKKIDAEELTPFVCELCGLAFKKQCFLRYHQRKHTGERPYKCPQCSKTFQLSGALATHAAVHGRREHSCRVCDRVFTFKSALNKHMKIHLNIRPHRCDICDKSFISPCDVRLHIKYVHNKVPWPKRDRIKRTQEENFTQY